MKAWKATPLLHFAAGAEGLAARHKKPFCGVDGYDYPWSRAVQRTWRWKHALWIDYALLGIQHHFLGKLHELRRINNAG